MDFVEAANQTFLSNSIPLDFFFLIFSNLNILSWELFGTTLFGLLSGVVADKSNLFNFSLNKVTQQIFFILWFLINFFIHGKDFSNVGNIQLSILFILFFILNLFLYPKQN